MLRIRSPTRYGLYNSLSKLSNTLSTLQIPHPVSLRSTSRRLFSRSVSTYPSIDIQHLQSGDSSLRQQTLTDLREALHQRGFFYAHNVTALSAAYLSDVYDFAAKAHSLPLEIKQYYAKCGSYRWICHSVNTCFVPTFFFPLLPVSSFVGSCVCSGSPPCCPSLVRIAPLLFWFLDISASDVVFLSLFLAGPILGPGLTN